MLKLNLETDDFKKNSKLFFVMFFSAQFAKHLQIYPWKTKTNPKLKCVNVCKRRASVFLVPVLQHITEKWVETTGYQMVSIF